MLGISESPADKATPLAPFINCNPDTTVPLLTGWSNSYVNNSSYCVVVFPNPVVGVP